MTALNVRPFDAGRWTRTGAVNTYMADVNHRLGFETVGRYGVVSRPLGQ